MSIFHIWYGNILSLNTVITELMCPFSIYVTWREGDIPELIREGKTIQCRLPSTPTQANRSNEQRSRTFAKLMMEGKVKAAIRLLSDDSRGGVLTPDYLLSTNPENETVLDSLLKKHPTPKMYRQIRSYRVKIPLCHIP